VFESKRETVKETGENYVMMRFMIFAPNQNMFVYSNQGG
jgi:hypothetical protein